MTDEIPQRWRTPFQWHGDGIKLLALLRSDGVRDDRNTQQPRNELFWAKV
jgi:hypothetical protein